MFSRLKLLVILTYLIISLACCGCGNPPAEKEVTADGIKQNDNLLQYFAATHPDQEALKCARGDLNADHTVDLVVIYRAKQDKNMLVAVLDVKGKLKCTNEVPAPASNQQIQFKDIDQKPPLEFIVQGVKGAHVGYAIYRLEEGRLVDLFGDGMKECCFVEERKYAAGFLYSF